MAVGSCSLTRPSEVNKNISIPHNTTSTISTSSKCTNTKKPGIFPRVEPSEVPMETQGKRKSVRPPRVAPSKVPMVTQEEINHTAPTIPIETHNMATKIEYEPLPWYLVNVVIDPYTGDILH